jgi:threonyl-tRNA synthetase
MGKKIREAEMNKIPYMLIIGEAEVENETVSVRRHGGDDLGEMPVESFAKILETETDKEIYKFEV